MAKTFPFKSLNIKGLNIKPPLILAPMSELSCAPLRQLVAQIGGCGLFYTEMLNSRIISSCSLKDDPFLITGNESPIVAQLVGNDPKKIEMSIKRLEELGIFSGFDINMGCSRNSIMRHGWGLALFEDIDSALKVLEAARGATDLPLIVKIRSGVKHDLKKMIERVKAFSNIGCDAVVLHPRAKKDGFKRPARWEEIKILKQEIDIPVIGNGDITSVEDIFKMYNQTGCDAVMIGRAAIVRPWIFRQAIDKDFLPDPVDILEKAAINFEQLLPKELASKRFYLFLSWYLRNWPFFRYVLKGLNTSMSVKEMLLYVKEKIRDQKPVLDGPCFISRI